MLYSWIVKAPPKSVIQNLIPILCTIFVSSFLQTAQMFSLFHLSEGYAHFEQRQNKLHMAEGISPSNHLILLIFHYVFGYF